MKRSKAEILREYGPFPGVDKVNGVTFDGRDVWFASGDKLNAFDPASGSANPSGITPATVYDRPFIVSDLPTAAAFPPNCCFHSA